MSVHNIIENKIDLFSKEKIYHRNSPDELSEIKDLLKKMEDTNKVGSKLDDYLITSIKNHKEFKKWDGDWVAMVLLQLSSNRAFEILNNSGKWKAIYNLTKRKRDDGRTTYPLFNALSISNIFEKLEPEQVTTLIKNSGDIFKKVEYISDYVPKSEINRSHNNNKF